MIAYIYCAIFLQPESGKNVMNPYLSAFLSHNLILMELFSNKFTEMKF